MFRLMGYCATQETPAQECAILFLEEVLYCFVGHHLLIENISTGLRALYHFDNFGICSAIL